MKTNNQMQREMKLVNLNDINLNDELLSIATSGFEYVDGCFFIKDLFSIDTNASQKDFPDKSGYECFINSVNIDDYVDEDYFSQAFLFVKKVFECWGLINIKDDLEVILSIDSFGLKLKLHLIRMGEQYLSDDLEDFDEAILIIKSSENIDNILSDAGVEPA